MKASTAVRACAIAVAACTGPMAMADASLTLTQTSAQCVTLQSNSATGLTERLVTPTCPSGLIINNVTRGGPLLSFLELTYAFAYRDDGLALPSTVTLPTGFYGGQSASAFARPPSVSFESATLNVDVTSSFGPNPAGPGYVIRAVSTDAPGAGISVLDGYLMFGLNDQPDAFSGNLSITIGVTAYGLQDVAAVTSVSVAPSIAAAIPEPSTYALMLGGLAFVFLARRSRLNRCGPAAGTPSAPSARASCFPPRPIPPTADRR